jgi:hypothetical protein
MTRPTTRRAKPALVKHKAGCERRRCDGCECVCTCGATVPPWAADRVAKPVNLSHPPVTRRGPRGVEFNDAIAKLNAEKAGLVKAPSRGGMKKRAKLVKTYPLRSVLAAPRRGAR